VPRSRIFVSELSCQAEPVRRLRAGSTLSGLVALFDAAAPEEPSSAATSAGVEATCRPSGASSSARARVRFHLRLLPVDSFPPPRPSLVGREGGLCRLESRRAEACWTSRLLEQAQAPCLVTLVSHR
jgi:hypothetical protein